MLRLAAVLGREFEFGVLVAASGAGDEALIDSLECASRAQLLEAVSAGRDVTFAFTHALIPATLYDGVSILRRRRLHQRVAAAIERLHPDDLESLAYHYSEAGDEERALAYHTRAGARASAAYANVEAEGHYRAALELVEVEAERADLLQELGRVLSLQGGHEEAIGVWQEGIAAYQALDDLDGIARLYARSADAAWDLGDKPRGLALCREGMVAVAGAPESPDQADLLHETARACFFNGVPDEAATLCRQALEMAERMGAVRVQAEALTTLGLLPSLPYEESLAAFGQAIELAESAGLLAQAARAHNNLGVRLIDPRASREHVLRAAELYRQRGDIRPEMGRRFTAAIMSLMLGDLAAVEEAISSLRQLKDAAKEPGRQSVGLRWLEVLLLRYQGELAQAIEGLQSLRTEAREAGDLEGLAVSNATLARVCIWKEVRQEGELEAILQEWMDLCERGVWSAVEVRSLQSVQRARQGEPEAARHLLSEAQEQAAEQGTVVEWEPDLSWAEANLAMAEGHWPEALAAFEATVDTLGRSNLRWRRARTLIDWAGAHLARGESGDRQRAEELLREAEAEFEAMGAQGYVERVRARLQELSAVDE
jgi:tetratricopeptide (TPR) repeat protein